MKKTNVKSDAKISPFRQLLSKMIRVRITVTVSIHCGMRKNPIRVEFGCRSSIIQIKFIHLNSLHIHILIFLKFSIEMIEMLCIVQVLCGFLLFLLKELAKMRSANGATTSIIYLKIDCLSLAKCFFFFEKSR